MKFFLLFWLLNLHLLAIMVFFALHIHEDYIMDADSQPPLSGGSEADPSRSESSP